MTFTNALRQSLTWRGVYFITLFLVNLILSRFLQADGSGVVYYISNTFIFVHLVGSLSLENGITYFAAGGRLPANKLLWLCLMWTAVLIMLQLILYTLFPFASSYLSSQKIAQYAFCYITGLLLTTYCTNIFYAGGNFFLPNLLLSFLNTAFIGFVVTGNGWLHNISKENITDAYFYMLLMQGVCLLLACILKNKSWLQFALPQLADIKKLTGYSLTVLLFNILLFLVYRVDYYFVRYSPVCTPSDLGNYIQASKLGQMMLVIPQIIGSAVYPQVSSGKDIENVGKLIMVLIKTTALLFLLFFIFIFLVGKALFPFVFGSTFTETQVPFLWLLPGIFGLSVISFLSNYFSGQGNVSISVRAASIALIVVIAGDFAFVYRYGIIAAAIVSMIGYLVMCSPYLVGFVKQRGIRLKDFFRFSKSDWFLLSSIWKKRNE